MSIELRENIFIYGVCGRSSSTALQRILNSSDEVFIFGEHNLIIEKMIDCYFQIDSIDHATHSKEWSKILECYKNKSHVSFYANATKDLREVQEEIKESIIKVLTPPTEHSRIGYKEINTKSQTSLLNLEKLFPESNFVFLFRDPLEQWGSVGFLKSFWDYSKKVDLFLQEYERVASIYLNTPVKKSFFIENTSLKDKDKVTGLLKKLNIDHFDETLVGKTISSTNKKKISLYEKARILSSKAFRLYQEMKKQELKWR